MTSTSWWPHWEPKTAAHLSDYWKASRNCLSKSPHLHHAPQRSCQCYIRATQALRKSEMRARVGWWGGAGVLSEWEFGISKARLFPLQQLPGHLLPLWRSVASDHGYFFIFPPPTNARKRRIFKPVLTSSSMNMKGLRRRSPQDNCVNSLRKRMCSAFIEFNYSYTTNTVLHSFWFERMVLLYNQRFCCYAI